MSAPRLNLNVLDVPNPCSVPWDSMEGDDVTRFCGQCNKYVYNLTNMTRDEAAEIVASAEGSLCVQFWRRADGTIVTRDCTPIPPGSPEWVAMTSFVVAVITSLWVGFYFGRKTEVLNDWFEREPRQTFFQVGGGIGMPGR